MKTENSVELEISNCCEEFEWEDYMFCLDSMLRKVNEHMCFYIEGRNMGWQNRSGYMKKSFESALDFCQNVFPETEWFARFTQNEDGLFIRLSHHDSPTGEHYEVKKADVCATCGDVYLIEEMSEDEEGFIVCEQCRKDGEK